jgi:PAS domain S-box-containing protein
LFVLVNDVQYLPRMAKTRSVSRGSRPATDGLRAKTKELDWFFELALDLLCVADTKGRFRKLSRSWETTLGYPIDELKKIPILDLVHPDDVEGVIRARVGLAEQRPVLNLVNRYRCKDGSYRWLEWRSISGPRRLIYCVARDITDRKQAEAERERLVGSLSEALASVKTLRGFIPICAWCKKVRDDGGFWHAVEVYVRDHSEAQFSHGMCPGCEARVQSEWS